MIAWHKDKPYTAKYEPGCSAYRVIGNNTEWIVEAKSAYNALDIVHELIEQTNTVTNS